MKLALLFALCCLIVSVSFAAENEKPKEGGFRQWLGGKLGISTTTTTTTTTAKPNVLQRAQNFYQEQKDKLKKNLDPRQIVAKQVSNAILAG